ncbi:hypothetical protein ENBRE01_0010 [Enteropsectra breve]|nr:hypothetical protein ENBRE01_0010 [Enteropsectra breve]
MENFYKLNKFRNEHGYTQGQFKKYKTATNKMFRRLLAEKSDNSYIYKMESNLCKFLLLRDRVFLKKNKKMLSKMLESSEFDKIYAEYTDCFLENVHGGTDASKLLNVRNKLMEYHSFVEDISLLNDGKHDFDNDTISFQWKDLELSFENETMLSQFKNKTLVLNDHRYNTQLANKIIGCESSMDTLNYRISERETGALQNYTAASHFYNEMKSLFQFLDDNLVDSPYVSSLLESARAVHEFFDHQLSVSTGKKRVSKKDFLVPKYFEQYKEDLEYIASHTKIQPGELRKQMIEKLQKMYRDASLSAPLMPQAPVFYDIAYDYIKYPSNETEFSGIFKGLAGILRKN